MNARKILIIVLMAVSISQALEVKKIKPYVALVGNAYTQPSDGRVIRKNTSSIWFQGDYRVVITQTKNPCFFFDKEEWETFGKKINNNTVELINYLDLVTSDGRPDLGYNLSFHSDGKITNSYSHREVIQVLGTSKDCYLRNTTEEYRMYDKATNTLSATMKITLVSDGYPLSPQVKNNETQTNQKTRIKIYKFGASDGFGRTFNTPAECEAERVKLTKSHKGLDYSYTCEKI